MCAIAQSVLLVRCFLFRYGLLCRQRARSLPDLRGAATLYARYQYTISRADLLLTKSAAERQWRERLT
jgi:hypothetical protein